MRPRLAGLPLVLITLVATSTAGAQTWRDPGAAAIGFGGSAVVAGDQVLIGRPGTLVGFPIPASHAGTVHVFGRSGDQWPEQGTIVPKDGTLGDAFGVALAVEGALLAVGAPGGSGQTFEWSRVPPDLQAPMLLAGGLHPGNVFEAVTSVLPWGVDVSSGVESSPGIKDGEKMRHFVEAVRRADCHVEHVAC